MQPATLLTQILQSGKITLSTDHTKDLEVSIADNQIDVNVTNKEFVKEALIQIRQTRQTSPISRIQQISQIFTEKPTELIKNGLNHLKSAAAKVESLRDLAEDLRDAGITLTFSYKGERVFTMGKDAKPTLSVIATGSDAIEINSTKKLLELGL